ncbi:MAG: PKD domain-containing protein, partial [Bacteroidia bacterium]
GNNTTLNAGGATTYSWSPGGGLSSTTGASVTANPITTSVYTVTGTLGTCTAVATTTVTVNSLPAVTVNSATICLGQQTATLTAGGASTYSWTPSTGLSSSAGTTVLATPVTTSTYIVTGTDGNGCVSTDTSVVTVNSLPVILCDGSAICGGAFTTLNASGAVTYSWMPGTGLSSTIGQSVNANPSSTTQYTVVGIDANGCFGGDTANVTVITNPTINVASATICIGNSTTLTASGASTYTWSPATGLSSTNGASVVANPTTTSVYTINGTVGTCTATTTATVNVNALPVIMIGSNSPVCVNQTLNLNSSGGVTYGWTGPNSFSSTQQNPTITGVTMAANGTYNVIVTDGNSCVNTATVNVVVHPLPVVSVTGATVCLNATFTLTANGGVAYSWSGPGGYSSNLQNPVITNASGAVAGSYVVTVTDTNSCINANVAIVVVNSPPAVTVTSATVCQGTPGTLIATGANFYNWSPSTGLSSTTSATVNATPASTTTYSVIGTDLFGCKDTVVTTITIIPSPPVAITPTLSFGCQPVCTSFSNTTTAIGTYSWTFGDGTTSNMSNPTHCFTGQGTFYAILSIVDANGCKNSDTAKIVVYPNPVADFSADPQPTTILDPLINFYNQSTTPGSSLSSLHWTFGDPLNQSSIFPNPSHTYLEPGTYPVQLVVIAKNGCADSITKYIVIQDEYSIYVPNAFSPNSDGVNDYFFAKGEGIKDFKMYIFDRWGNQVFFSDDIYKGWDGRYQSKGNDIVQEDVYVWKIDVKFKNNQSKLLKGTVSLIK